MTTRDWLRDPAELKRRVDAAGSFAALARQTGIPASTIKSAWHAEHNLGNRGAPVPTAAPEGDEWLVELLRRRKKPATITELADAADVSPRRVRETLDRLGEHGYRIADENQRIELVRVPPDTTNLHPGLFDGNDLLLGVVSDTHLGSKAEALEELHLAYSIFELEGVTDVLHAGDISTGLGVFRGQDAEVKVHTLDEAVAYAVANYPRARGVTTRLIGGNHDLEGEASRVGFDLAQAIASQRDDLDYLGAYSAWLGVGDDPETAPWVHLLHGKGGMSYSYSYKAQKLVDGYPAGRKPAILVPGHWHVRGSIEHRSVEVLWPGCFEWQSTYMARLGLHPAVGFHLLHVTFGTDGSLVKFLPRWLKFHAGRLVG